MTLKKYVAMIVLVALLGCSLAIPAATVFAAGPTGTVSIGTREMAGKSGVYELLINQQVVVRYRSAANGYSAAVRAQLIMERIKDFGSDILTKPLHTGTINGSPVIMLGEKLLITVTKADWEANNTNGSGLAKVWRDNLAQALHNEQSSPAPVIPPENKQIPTPNPQDPQEPVSGVGSEEQEMLKLVNEERAAAGLNPLKMDPKLVEIARMKSQDMILKNYFSHTSPTYGDPFTMMKDYGVQFGYAGENLAGNPSMQNAHRDLMNSPGHRANILNPNYTHIGIGIVEGGAYGKMFTQLFISK